jgi:Na+-transporting NADH:ubiquinone oxidoreductase subunit A
MGEATGYLGRYHRQVSVLTEAQEPVTLGWMAPGMRRYSIMPTFLSTIFGTRGGVAMSTALFGERRAIVPIGVYERVMPMDIHATPLLRALVSGNLEAAEELGALELEEEDLGLCTFVCPGKVDYGAVLRERLDAIWEEG